MQTLRMLAADYADGKIDRKTFITERRRLIDGIVAGEIPLPPDEDEPAAPLHGAEPEQDEDITIDVAELGGVAHVRPVRPVGAARNGKPWVAIAVALVVAAVVAAIVYQRMTPKVSPAAGRIPPADAATSPSLVTAYVAANRWDEASIQGFMAAWNALPAGERDALRGTPAMSQLSELLQTRFNEARALLELGDRDNALAAQRRLLELARTLAISNERVERMAAEVRAASAAPAQAATAVPPAPALPTASPATPPTTSPPPAPAPALESAPAAPAPAVSTAAAPAAVDTPHAASPPPVSAAPSAPETPAAEPGPALGCTATLAAQRRPYCRDKLASGGSGPLLVVLPGGAYTMGGRRPEESPRHRVNLSQPFAMSVFEVSARELAAYCAAAGTACPQQPWDDPRYPAVNVPWKLATSYAAWLSTQSQARYRLPSEAEWEYAARAGADTEYPFGDELLPIHARFSFRAPETKPLPADDRSVNKNRFRLYHMVGNVREWMADAWTAGYAGLGEDPKPRLAPEAGPHVVRGGSYADPAERLRSAARGPGTDAGDAFTGIRLVRELPPPAAP